MGIQWFFENPTGTRRRFVVVRSLLMRCKKDTSLFVGAVTVVLDPGKPYCTLDSCQNETSVVQGEGYSWLL